MKPLLSEDRGAVDISGAVPHTHKAPPPARPSAHDEVQKLGNDMGIVVGDVFKLHEEVRNLRKELASIQNDIAMLSQVVLPQP